VARVYLYIQDTYGLILTQQQTLYQTWNKKYPKLKWEMTREARILQIQQ
jgi:endonuclease I